MALYQYKGVGKNGKATKGVREADSPKFLRQLLRKEGILVTDTVLAKSSGNGLGAGKGLGKEVEFTKFFQKVKKIEVAAFTRQLATLLKAGIPLAETIGALSEQQENLKFKSIVDELKSSVNEGTSMADAVAKYPDVFDDLYVSMVRGGEQAGNLDEVLERLADFMDSAIELKSKVTSAMIYPMIMLVVGGLIMAIMLIAVVPKITEIFDSQGALLPWPTRFLKWVSNSLSKYWWLLIIMIVGSVILFKKWKASEKGKPVYDRWLLKVPLLGALVKQIAVSRFTRTMGTMLEAGVPMLRTLETSKQVLGNHVLEEAVAKTKSAVTEGASLAQTLKESGHFPPTVTHMMAVGERSGALEQMLLRISEAYDREVSVKLERFTAMLEPLMMVGMGGTVGFVVFAILMPMMEMQKLTNY